MTGSGRGKQRLPQSYDAPLTRSPSMLHNMYNKMPCPNAVYEVSGFFLGSCTTVYLIACRIDADSY